MNYIADSCFWFALYTESDQYHNVALERYEKIIANTADSFIIPFPSLYETINTKLAKKTYQIRDFKNLIDSGRCVLIYDNQYRDDAYEIAFRHNVSGDRPLALVDVVIRLIIDDVNVKTDALLSYNSGDFIDVCQARNVQLVNY